MIGAQLAGEQTKWVPLPEGIAPLEIFETADTTSPFPMTDKDQNPILDAQGNYIYKKQFKLSLRVPEDLQSSIENEVPDGYEQSYRAGCWVPQSLGGKWTVDGPGKPSKLYNLIKAALGTAGLKDFHKWILAGGEIDGPMLVDFRVNTGVKHSNPKDDGTVFANADAFYHERKFAKHNIGLMHAFFMQTSPALYAQLFAPTTTSSDAPPF